ncbi:hypothetical protein AB0B63_18615 [Micromonospora sp. NPDC049081]|uniref:hypothetical protein n=1 Tax=Micromonospora sp. NPDC049081 TaxID=3155150 RepID=UPI00340463FE
MPVELYVVTPRDLLVAWIAWVVITLAAVGFAVLVLRQPPACPVCGGVDSPESARTVELPRNRVRGPRTGSLHGPVHRPDLADAPTTVIERVHR